MSYAFIAHKRAIPTNITQGALPGETISALLFCLFINDIWYYFQSRAVRDINIDGQNDVSILAFADDRVILAH